jgi:GntR family phosphonate transport system transcriptional regulator
MRKSIQRVRGESGVTVWAQIERQLAGDIAQGRMPPGSRLPAEHALAERFAVNRHTVRQALGSLASRGLVDVRHGSGTFVADFAVDYALGRRTRFSTNLAASGLKGRHRLLESDELKASATIAARLGCRPGTRILRLLTLGEAHGRPVSLAEHHFRAARTRGLVAAFESLGSISAALGECGITDFTRRESRITARIPDEAVARRLGQPPGRPALYVEGLNVDAEGKPLEFGRTWFSGDRVQLVVAPEA